MNLKLIYTEDTTKARHVPDTKAWRHAEEVVKLGVSRAFISSVVHLNVYRTMLRQGTLTGLSLREESTGIEVVFDKNGRYPEDTSIKMPEFTNVFSDTLLSLW